MENSQGKPTSHFRWMAIWNSTMKPHAVLSRMWVIPLSSMPTLPAAHESFSNCLSHQVICHSVTVAAFMASLLYFVESPTCKTRSAKGLQQGKTDWFWWCSGQREKYAQLRVATVGSLRHPSSVGHWGKKPDDSEIRHGSEGPLHHSSFGSLTFGKISNCSHTH